MIPLAERGIITNQGAITERGITINQDAMAAVARHYRASREDVYYTNQYMTILDAVLERSSGSDGYYTLTVTGRLHNSHSLPAGYEIGTFQGELQPGYPTDQLYIRFWETEFGIRDVSRARKGSGALVIQRISLGSLEGVSLWPGTDDGDPVPAVWVNDRPLVGDGPQCSKYRYSDCPVGCRQACVSSHCTPDGICTADCVGPGSCGP